MSLPKYASLELSLNNGVLLLTLSRPGGNSMSHGLFQDWHKALIYARDEPAVRVLVVTGKGKFFSTGKDLQNVMHVGFEKEMNEEMDTLQAMVDELINFRKPMIAAVNGPAIGFGVTCLSHFDFVYAVETATFMVPFMRWGFCCEGCSSLLFPQQMGKHTANQLLLGGEQLNAAQLSQVGFLEILPVTQSAFLETVLAKAAVLSSYDPAVVDLSRNFLIKTPEERLLRSRVNRIELTHIRKLMMADSSRKPIQAFVDARAAKMLAKAKSKM